VRAAEPPKPKAEEPPKPSSHTVRRELFEVKVTTKGVFEAERMVEIVLRPDVWADLFVLSAVAPGTRVKKGDGLLTLDTTKMDEAIRNLEEGQPLAELGLRLAQEEAAALEKSVPLDLVAADRAKKTADENLQRYVQVDRPLEAKSAQFGVKRAQDVLAYETEELRQLEKMYKADDLTEETEEIILKRQRDTVEVVTFNLEVAKTKADQTLTVDLPRRDVATRENVERQDLALTKARASLPLAAQKARLEADKQRLALEKARDQLAKLRKDREAMAVRAPADGVVYYGPCVRGEWPQLARSLARGTKLAPHEVALTLVEPQPLFVRAGVPEGELHRLQPDLEGVATPTGYPDARLGARLRSVSAIPVAAGKFELTLAVTLGDLAARIVPGMTCDIEVVSYRKPDALSVPLAAVFSDEADGKPCVYVQPPAGGPERRLVSLGRKSDKKAEILQGVSEGDVVLLEKPKAK
jgi:multidrug resistance efflux pump